jgi:hypothetical protein
MTSGTGLHHKHRHESWRCALGRSAGIASLKRSRTLLANGRDKHFAIVARYSISGSFDITQSACLSCPVGPRALADRHFLVDRRVPAGPEDLVLVSVVHSVAMMMAGGFSAWLVYRYLGLKFVSRSWFNLDVTWAVSLTLVGALSLAILANEH